MRKKYCNIHVLCLLLFRCGLTNSGELIAVKQIKLDTDNIELAEEEYEKIQEEVSLLKTLRHTHIVGYAPPSRRGLRLAYYIFYN